MLNDKVPEIAYKKGVEEGGASTNPLHRPCNKRCLAIVGISLLILTTVLALFLYFGLSEKEQTSTQGDLQPRQNDQQQEAELRALLTDLRNTVCDLGPETGPCRAHFEKFHFDPATGTCLPFVYGGCAGNDNNFETVEECMNLCGAKPILTDCPYRFRDLETGACELNAEHIKDIQARRAQNEACPQGQRIGRNGQCQPI